MLQVVDGDEGYQGDRWRVDECGWEDSASR